MKAMKERGAWSLVLLLFRIGQGTGVEDIANVGCTLLNGCSGHGTCVYGQGITGTTTTWDTKRCLCWSGWGAPTDVFDAGGIAPDCSERVCPSGNAWGDVATLSTTAHAKAECSGVGTCDRTTGTCSCPAGYGGPNCGRYVCPNDCNGRGRCLHVSQLAATDVAHPLSAVVKYNGASTSATWDQDKLYACVCDTAWSVGLDSGETQEAEYFGPSCEFRRCPTGDDPDTILTTINSVTVEPDETKALNKKCSTSLTVGSSGNLCHVDCSNRGICDYTTGVCTCFEGWSGHNCGARIPWAEQS
ncbi:unnamed protein product [Chrysoparadoxa australica]